MKHQEGMFQGMKDTEIYHQGWQPEGDSKALLLTVHGLAEHSGRYMNLVNHFTPRGYALYGFDHPGHGRSRGTRVFVDRFEDYRDTLKIYFNKIREWEPEKPIFLVGHSMGGLIAAMYLLEHQKDFKGAILSGPLVKVPDNTPRPLILLGRLLSALTPRAGLIPLEAEGVSRDPAVVKAYENDPLVYRGKITARLSAELLKAMAHIRDHGARITLPIFIVQGGADKLVDPDGARILHDRVSSRDKNIRIYEGFYHELFNDPGHEQVLKDVFDWMETRLERKEIK